MGGPFDRADPPVVATLVRKAVDDELDSRAPVPYRSGCRCTKRAALASHGPAPSTERGGTEMPRRRKRERPEPCKARAVFALLSLIINLFDWLS